MDSELSAPLRKDSASFDAARLLIRTRKTASAAIAFVMIFFESKFNSSIFSLGLAAAAIVGVGAGVITVVVDEVGGGDAVMLTLAVSEVVSASTILVGDVVDCWDDSSKVFFCFCFLAFFLFFLFFGVVLLLFDSSSSSERGGEGDVEEEGSVAFGTSLLIVVWAVDVVVVELLVVDDALARRVVVATVVVGDCVVAVAITSVEATTTSWSRGKSWSSFCSSMILSADVGFVVGLEGG
jgi:hypothetical protein